MLLPLKSCLKDKWKPFTVQVANSDKSRKLEGFYKMTFLMTQFSYMFVSVEASV